MLKKEVSVGGYAQKEVSVGRYTQVQPTVPQLSVKSSCINTTKKNMYLGGGGGLPSVVHPTPFLAGHASWGSCYVVSCGGRLARRKEKSQCIFVYVWAWVWVGVADGSVLYLY